MNEADFYQFGNFRIDTNKQQLTRLGQEIDIRPRLFEVLLFLIRNRGKVVTREAILD